MWINRARYDDLVRAEERAEWFRVRINQLEQQLAAIEFKRTGVPQPALEIVGRTLSGEKKPDPSQFDPLKEMLGGVVSFEDMGDIEARRNGYRIDEEDGVPAMR